MNTVARLGAYTGGPAVEFAAAFDAGAAADPLNNKPQTSHATDKKGTHLAGTTVDHTAQGLHTAQPASATLPGLTVSQDGYTLVPAATPPAPTRATGRKDPS